MNFGVQTLILCALLAYKGSAYCSAQPSISSCSTDTSGNSCTGMAGGCCLKIDVTLNSATISSTSSCYPCPKPLPTITFQQNVVDSLGTPCQCGQIQARPAYFIYAASTETTCNNVCCKSQSGSSSASSTSSTGTGGLIGIVIGGVAVIVLIIVGVYCYLKKRNSASTPAINEVPDVQVQSYKVKAHNSEYKIHSDNQPSSQLKNRPLKDRNEEP